MGRGFAEKDIYGVIYGVDLGWFKPVLFKGELYLNVLTDILLGVCVVLGTILYTRDIIWAEAE